ncbi:MAG: AI-2E family transporter [Reyranellaceae bacterium]|jgi:predicted PurR-regulated permease PerM
MTIERPDGPASVSSGTPTAWRHVVAVPIVVLAVVSGIALVCYSAPSLLLLFAGILFAALLDACTRALRPVLPFARPWRYALVVLVLGSGAVFALGWSIVRLPGQVQGLIAVMDAQLSVLERELAGFGIDLFGPGGRQDLFQLLSDPGRLFGHVQYAVSGAYGVVMNTIVVVCLGLFFAGQPAAYREGALILVPKAARARVRTVMNEMGEMLRNWLLGQLLRSAVVAVLLAVSFQILGVAGAPLLGLQAGVANFIPYLGPLLAAFPVILVAMPMGLPTLAWVVVIYFTIQTIEGFLIAPLIQKGSVNLAPAWTLFAIVIFGAIFGAMGVALAAPIFAVARVATLRFYVEDWLGDRTHAERTGGAA